ncbi:MAG TPA: SPW repeat protein [Thermomicrobiaceae bacterium]|nr:SPW repeat protein [Thermomicrobiaceae bacterium]
MEARQPSSPALDLVAALNIGFGILLLFLPYVTGYSLYSGARMTDAIFGPLVIGMAIVRLSFPPRYRIFSLGNVIFGVWVLITPFVLGYTSSTSGTIVNVVLGILIALVAATGFLR